MLTVNVYIFSPLYPRVPNIPPAYPDRISPSYITMISSLYPHYIYIYPQYIPQYIRIISSLYPHYILTISSLHPHYTCSLYIPEYISLEQKSPLIDFHSRFCKLCHMSYIPSLGSITRVLTGMNHQVL